jgi:hypothetical protein
MDDEFASLASLPQLRGLAIEPLMTFDRYRMQVLHNCLTDFFKRMASQPAGSTATVTGDETGIAALLSPPLLTSLSLRQSWIGPYMARALSPLLQHHSSDLQLLDLSESILNDDALRVLCRCSHRPEHVSDSEPEVGGLAACTPSLRILQLGGNRFQLEGFTALASQLWRWRHLAVLDLSCSHLHYAVALFAAVLPECKALRVLDLSHCSLLDTDVLRLSAALARCMQLHRVDLRGNWILYDGARALAAALLSNRAIRIVDVTGCSAECARVLRAVKLQRFMLHMWL